MIVIVTALVALPPPATHVAVFDLLRIVGSSDRAGVLSNRLFETPADEPKVGSEVLDAIGLDRRGGIGRNDVEVLRRRGLHHPKKIRVQRELQHRPATGFLRELGIDDFVRP